jgi:hypothetical protein
MGWGATGGIGSDDVGVISARGGVNTVDYGPFNKIQLAWRNEL